MKKSKIIAISITVIIFSIAVYIVGEYINFNSNTMAVEDAIEYCKVISKRNSTKFSAFGDPRNGYNYLYYVSLNGNKNEPQEIFIFEQKYFSLFSFVFYGSERLKLVTSSVTDHNTEENKVGVIKFYTADDTYKNTKGSTLIFYGVKNECDVRKCEYKLTISDGTGSFERNVLHTDKDECWYTMFFDVDVNDSVYLKHISEVKLYDKNGNIVYSY